MDSERMLSLYNHYRQARADFAGARFSDPARRAATKALTCGTHDVSSADLAIAIAFGDAQFGTTVVEDFSESASLADAVLARSHSEWDGRILVCQRCQRDSGDVEIALDPVQLEIHDIPAAAPYCRGCFDFLADCI